MKSLFRTVTHIAAALVLLAAVPPVSAAIIFVDTEATGANSGVSWADAFTDLVDALNAANDFDEIWVAEGIYTPGSLRTDTFAVPARVTILGGFDGGETAVEQRSFADHPTILSGEIGTPGSIDNVHHVVTAIGVDISAIVDGFTIRDGNAVGADIPHGGGILSLNASPSLRNVIITDNVATIGGGAHVIGGGFVFVNALVYGNSAVRGGGLSGSGADGVVTNCTVAGNSASVSGGGLYLDGLNTGWFTNFNTIYHGNSAPIGPNIESLVDKPGFSHCIVEGSNGSGPGWNLSFGSDRGGNLDIDPVFVNVPANNYQLSLFSGAIDKGSLSPPLTLAVDLGGMSRQFGLAIDIGAYELHVECPPSQVYYVDNSASGTGDGSSWADAFTDPRSAFVLTYFCPQIQEAWVAAGVYPTDPGGDRDATFAIPSGLSIYGGFAGNETTREQRNWWANPTVLSGAIGTTADEDNAYHVVTIKDANAQTRLDGFSIFDGFANGPDSEGAGLLVQNSDAVLANLLVARNRGADRGAGIYVVGGTPSITHSRFVENIANFGGRGGAIATLGSTASIANCSFRVNNAHDGAALSLVGSQTTLLNITAVYNPAYFGGNAIHIKNGHASFSNSILWSDINRDLVRRDNGTAWYRNCFVEGSGGSTDWDTHLGADGGNNNSANPRLVSSSDFRPTGISPVVDRGDNNAAAQLTTDLNGLPRFDNAVVDVGAYEYQGSTCPPYDVLYVDVTAEGNNDGSSWHDAFVSLGDALANACGAVKEVWVAGGVYPATLQGLALRSGIKVLGGFAGHETHPDARDWLRNQTILSGEIGQPGPVDNPASVVVADQVGGGVVLDGIFVVAGRENGINISKSVVELTNVSCFGNRRGVNATESSLVLSDVTIAGSTNTGIQISSSSAVGTGLTLEGNVGTYGGGAAVIESEAVFVNSIFYGNAASAGGGIYNSKSSPTITNSAFVSNSTEFMGSAVFNTTPGAQVAQPAFWNCVMRGNSGAVFANRYFDSQGEFCYSTYRFCNLEGSGGSGAWMGTSSIDGGNNIDTDPMFVNQMGSDLRLTAGSANIDAGSVAAPFLPDTDLDGNPRVIGTTVDIGPFEYRLPTAIDPSAPLSLRFLGAYPNPFNPTLTVAFELDRARAVTVEVFNVRGQLVRTLANATLAAGGHKLTWSGVDRSGNDAASGVYLVRVKSEDWQVLRKVVLLK